MTDKLTPEEGDDVDHLKTQGTVYADIVCYVSGRSGSETQRRGYSSFDKHPSLQSARSCDSGYASLNTSPSDSYSPHHTVIDLEDEYRIQGLQSQHQGRLLSGAQYSLTPASASEINREEHQGIETSDQRRDMSSMTKQTASGYSRSSHQSTASSPTLEHDGGISCGANTEIDSSKETSSQSLKNDAWMTMAYAKHQMMVTLMRDVYTYFNSQWSAEVRSRTGSQEASTAARSQVSSPRTPPSTARGKRRRGDRDSRSPDANDDIRKKNKLQKSNDGGPERLFACFFHKYNPHKYCPNSDTGTKYRSCAGPGFSKISQLKQHLKRNHTVPIHCPRCWFVVNNQSQMALHVNAEERCERRDPQVLEGVDPDRIRLITETWGVTWEQIYEILFPGAPIPSPYYEVEDRAPTLFEPSSPQSRELRDFEAYNRTMLPRLVEANLRTIVESEVAPIEERVRAMVVDIVRTCQSTVARTFHHTIAPTSSTETRRQSSSQVLASTEITAPTLVDPAQTAVSDIAGTSLDFFHEPPLLNAEASASQPDPSYYDGHVDGDQHQNSDSGYSSLQHPCGCGCHDSEDTWDIANGSSNCQSCASRHLNLTESDIDFLCKDFDWQP